MKVFDLDTALAELDGADDDAPTLTALGSDGLGTCWALRVPRGRRWEGVAAWAIVLRGVGTWAVADRRSSLGSGHVVLLSEGDRLTVEADGPDPVTALLIGLETAPARATHDG